MASARSLGTLTLDLIARIGGFEQGMDKAGRNARKNFKTIETDASRTSKAVVSSLKGIASAAAGAFSLIQVGRSIEQWTTINNRLTLVTDTSFELLEAQRALFNIAQSSRQPLGATAELYQRIATNSESLKLSTVDLNTVVGNINKTLAISNTSGSAASAALVQLGQAFASGTLRGQELNSVLEQAPALAKAIADGMGVAVGELRTLSQAGKLSASAVIDALLNQTEAIDQSFGKITATVGQALPVLGNTFTRVVGNIDQMTGASSAVAEQIINLSEFIDSNFQKGLAVVTFSVKALSIAIAARLVTSVSAAALSFAAAQVQAIRYQVTLASMAGVSATAAVSQLSLAAASRAATGAMALVGGPVGAAVIAGGALLYLATRSSDAEKRLKELREAAENTVKPISDIGDAARNLEIADLTKTISETEDQVKRLTNLLEGVTKAGGTNTAFAATGDGALRVAADVELLNDSLDKMRARLDDLQSTGVSDGGAASQLSDKYLELEAKLNKQIALIGETSKSAELEYDIRNGLIEGLKDGEGELLIAKQRTLEAGQKAIEESKKEADQAKKLKESVTEQITAIERAAETWGMNANELKIYGLEVDGATEAQIKYAQSVLDTVENLDKAKQAQEDYKNLVKDLRTDEEKLADQLRERLKVLDQISNISESTRSNVAGRIAENAFQDAPEFAGLAPEVGGAFSELGKISEAQDELQDWYDTQLQMLEEFRSERSDLNSVWDEREKALKKEHEEEILKIEQARRFAQLTAAESVFGDLAGIVKEFAGEESSAYKALFAAQQAVLIAQTIMNAEAAAVAALAAPPVGLGPVAGAAYGGIIRGIGYASAGIIAGQTIAGMAHDGIDSVPQTGTWLLEKGERVTTADTSARLDRTLDNIETKGMAPDWDIVVNNNAPDSRATARVDDKKRIVEIMVEQISNQSSPVRNALHSTSNVAPRGTR